ncbi:hypothetical protein CCM_07012 [Cordyceps militaris CM01]|uniref:F-box domain-containing protein n=1 Tax=Cordyceps militaris (strain CM01) TaxID=983644 RepID=G3JLL8_CORMM|nr:uncharacterized protein CCM_07012 [Cordyceps militaris CM01]EGX90592.1 hypothetical protein CCM_07012 [Cordyceps militaris CM01]
MDRLPPELFEEILLDFAYTATRNDVLAKRLVCRAFNHVLRPLGCRTLSLESTRLNKQSNAAKPRTEGLQTIGHRCKALYIDMTPLRDDYEVETLTHMLQEIPQMKSFCRALRSRYSFSETSFTETDFYRSTAEILFYCRDVDRVRICLPFPVIGVQCSAATRVLANALKALGQRPDEDSVPLKTLAIECVPEDTLCELWMNPSDVMNMQALLPPVETLVLTIRRVYSGSFSTIMFGVALWNMIFTARNLQSLCLIDVNFGSLNLYGVLEVTTLADMDHVRWLEMRIPGPSPQLIPPKPTYLELEHISILPEDLLRIAVALGPSLEELHLCNVSLMTRQSTTENTRSDRHLWVGHPNEDPGHRLWMAMRFRALMPKLRVCRCSHLTYKLYTDLADPICEDFDYADPAGIGRSVSQRFVEVVMGLGQPTLPSGEPMYWRPHDMELGHLMHNLAVRRSRIPMSEHDYYAHRLAAVGGQPDYRYSLDGLFRNCATGSRRELQYILDRFQEGVTILKEQL